MNRSIWFRCRSSRSVNLHRRAVYLISPFIFHAQLVTSVRHSSLRTFLPPPLRSPPPAMAGPRSQSPPEQSPTQPSGPPSQPPSEAHAAFFLTRPDNTTRRLNAATPSLDDNSPSILDQRRQLAELLKHFPYQAPTGIRSNTPISPLCLSKNPSSNGSARETDADTDPSFYPSPVNSQTLHHPLEIDIFTHMDAEKLVAWIDKKKNPLSARAVARRYQVYLNQELSDAGSSPLGG